MKISQTPTLLHSDYTGAGCLKAEVAKAISRRDLPKTSAASKAAINAFFAALGATSIPATTALVPSGVKMSGVTVTGTGTFATPTVVNGKITGIVLSAS